MRRLIIVALGVTAIGSSALSVALHEGDLAERRRVISYLCGYGAAQEALLHQLGDASATTSHDEACIEARREAAVHGFAPSTSARLGGSQ